jgi:subtilisin
MGIRHSTVTASNMFGRNQFMGAIRWMLSAVFMASMLLWMPEAASAAPAAQKDAADKLIVQAQRQGSAAVIVRLRAAPDRRRSDADQQAAIQDNQKRVLAQLAGHEVSAVKRLSFIPYMAMTTDAPGIAALKASPDVLSIEEDVLTEPTLADSTTLIGADGAWSYGYAGAGQTIAILDTGVDKSHSFLANKVVSEACYSANLCPGGATSSTASGSGVNCATTISSCMHGTHVAGIAAGKGTSFSGVARDAQLIAIQVYTKYTTATDCSPASAPCVKSQVSDQLLAMDRVYALRTTFSIASVNLSLGGSTKFTAACDASFSSYKAAVDKLQSVGIATVIAAGNSSFTDGVSFPACISSAVTVGATLDGGSGGTPVDTIASFSNSSSLVDLLAPGQQINSSVPGGGFATMQGTSMAAPHVAGAFAILKGRTPSSSVATILSTLSSSGRAITDPRNNVTKSRIQLDRALNLPLNSAVWIPSTVAETTVIGMSDPDFRAKDTQLFSQGWRLTTLQNIVVDGQLRYTAVWQPGSGGQVWVAGWSDSAFRAKDTELFNQGYRLTTLQNLVFNGQVLYTAVWRPGTGGQVWVPGWSDSAFRAKDTELFNQGYRLTTLQNFVFNGQVLYTAVWRPGTGGQVWVPGWSDSAFRAKDTELFNQGYRLATFQNFVFNGQVLYTAVWRPGTGGQVWVPGWTWADFQAEYKTLFSQGWRLKVLLAFQ